MEIHICLLAENVLLSCIHRLSSFQLMASGGRGLHGACVLYPVVMVFKGGTDCAATRTRPMGDNSVLVAQACQVKDETAMQGSVQVC